MSTSERRQNAAATISQRIENLILSGTLRPGERLAPERDLAEKLNVSRPTLRDAIAQLADRGLLESSRSGTFVAEFLTPLISPLASLLAGKPSVSDDHFEFRRCLEPEAASLAARRATDLDHKIIRQCVARLEKAHASGGPVEEAEADMEFHLAICEAGHNVVMLHVMRVMAELMRKDVFYNWEQLYARSGVSKILLEQHEAIADAVIAGDVDKSRDAALAHVEYTHDTIVEIRRDTERMKASLDRVGRQEFLSA